MTSKNNIIRKDKNCILYTNYLVPQLKNVKSFVLFLCTFMFIFGWKIMFFVDIIFFISILFFVIAVVMGMRSIDKKILFILLVLLASFAWTLVATLLGGSGNLEMDMRIFRSLINFIGAVSLVYIYSKNLKNSHLILMGHVGLALAIHGIVIFFMWHWEYFRQLIYAITGAHSYVNLNTPFIEGLRVTGLTYGLSQTSVVQSWSVIYLILALFISPIKMRKIIIVFILILLSFFSILATGRTGLLFLIIVLPIIFYSIIVLISLSRKSFSSYASIVFVAIIAIASFEIRESNNDRIAYIVNQHYEVFHLLANRQSDTFDTVRGMYYFPRSIRGVLAGYGTMDRQDLGIVTDVGFVRGVFDKGVIGVFITLIPFFVGLILSLRAHVLGLIRKDKWLIFIGIFSFIVFLSTLFLNTKEVALLTRNQWSVQSILLVILLNELKNK